MFLLMAHPPENSQHSSLRVRLLLSSWEMIDGRWYMQLAAILKKFLFLSGPFFKSFFFKSGVNKLDGTSMS